MEKFSDHLETVKPGTRIVTITRGLFSPAFEQIANSTCEMGWGKATVNVYRRI